ncbi:hypothetical protein [Acetobacterium wieringae]|uniref:Uncharacterized protein n=1 Tax=Acetobacterium wieringae TaxID=52694 RepID=A0A1F2PKP4_9FIRM|nr:hypothetical protein [Acetobacterium wieringae]OFV71980.1 hypothetical protein ACWI_04540 [Acetobacterium wieringae]
MEKNTINDKIMMVNAQGIVLGASAACAEFLEQKLEQLNGIYILDLNFGLTLTQFLAYFEKIKKDHHFAFKTYFTNQANHMIHIDVRGIYVDSQE